MSVLYNYFFGQPILPVEKTVESYTIISNLASFDECDGLQLKTDVIAVYLDLPSAFAIYVSNIILYLKDNLKWTNRLENGIRNCHSDQEIYQFLLSYFSKKTGYTLSETLFTYGIDYSSFSGGETYELRLVAKPIGIK